jgi:hypothetical protein
MKRKKLERDPDNELALQEARELRAEQMRAARLRAKKRVIDSYDPMKHPQQVLQMVMNGALEREIISALGITKPIFDIWRTLHSEFANALNLGIDAGLADQRVARSIYEMANGYDIPAVKILQHEGQVIKVPYREHVPKNINAAKFWLANRDASNWGREPNSDKAQVPAGVINVNMIQGMSAEQLRQSIALLKSALAPVSQTQLRRLDVQEAEVVQKPKPKALPKPTNKPPKKVQ